MRIGTSISEFMGIPAFTWMKFVNTLAFDHVEFYSSVFLENPEKLIDQIRGKTVGIHLPYFDEGNWDLSSTHADQPFERLANRINSYKHQLQVKWLIVHPPEDPNPDWKRFFTRLEQFKTIILLENIKTQDVRTFTEVYRRVKKQFGERLGFCFDIVHAFLANEDFLDLPGDLCADLQYIHLNDTSSKESDEHWPLGSGSLPLEQVFSFLKRIQFNGVINLEIKPRSKMAALSVVDSYLRVLKHFQWRKYLQTKARLLVVKPVLKRKLESLKTY